MRRVTTNAILPGPDTSYDIGYRRLGEARLSTAVAPSVQTHDRALTSSIQVII